MAQADPKHNIPALLIGTAEFSFSEGVSTVAATLLNGWLDIGNIKAFTPQAKPDNKQHKGSYRGVKRTDKTVRASSEILYQLKADEWNHKLMELMFGASAGTDFTQAIQSAVSADSLLFTAPIPSGTQKWYDVMVAGARIRALTTVTIATLVEGTDFEVDLLLGRVRFLASQTATRVPVVTAAAITAGSNGSFKGLKPFGNVDKKGMGRLVVYDQESTGIVVLDHQDFSCELSLSASGEVTGEDFSEITIDVTVTNLPGNVLIRQANAN
jgi:hypothetical protein